MPAPDSLTSSQLNLLTRLSTNLSEYFHIGSEAPADDCLMIQFKEILKTEQIPAYLTEWDLASCISPSCSMEVDIGALIPAKQSLVPALHAMRKIVSIDSSVSRLTRIKLSQKPSASTRGRQERAFS